MGREFVVIHKENEQAIRQKKFLTFFNKEWEQVKGLLRNKQSKENIVFQN